MLLKAEEQVRQIEASQKHAETLKTLNMVENLKRKIVDDNKAFDLKMKASEEKLKGTMNLHFFISNRFEKVKFRN